MIEIDFECVCNCVYIYIYVIIENWECLINNYIYINTQIYIVYVWVYYKTQKIHNNRKALHFDEMWVRDP